MGVLRARADWIGRVLLASALVTASVPASALAEEALSDGGAESAVVSEQEFACETGVFAEEETAEETEPARETDEEKSDESEGPEQEGEPTQGETADREEVPVAENRAEASTSSVALASVEEEGKPVAQDDGAPSSFEFGNLTYSFVNGVLAIEGDGSIPDKAFYSNTCTGFSADAAAQTAAKEWVDAGIERIVIGSGVTGIGASAFAGGQKGAYRDKLVSVDMSASDVSGIGNSAFAQCISLQQVKLPSELATLGTQAFAYCTKLPATFALPGTVTAIGTNTAASSFGSTSSNKSSVTTILHPDWSKIDSAMYSKLESYKLFTLEKGSADGPFGTIGDSAGDDDKEEIVLPEKGGFTYNGVPFAWTVSGSTLHLERLGNPDNWTGPAAFAGSTGGDGLVALKQVVTDDNAASITTLEFGEGISEIPTGFSSSFLGFWAGSDVLTPNLNKVIFSTSITKVGVRAFTTYMEPLTSIEIPEGSNLTTISSGAFGAPNIEKLDLSTTKITTIGGESARIFTLPYDRIVFPDTLTTLKVNAFSSQSYQNLNGPLVIPDSVKVVEAGAFADGASWMAGITYVELPADIDFSPAAFGGSIDNLLLKRGQPVATAEPVEVRVRGTWNKDTTFYELRDEASGKAKVLAYDTYDLTGVVPEQILNGKVEYDGAEVTELLGSLAGENSLGNLGEQLYYACYRESTGADAAGLTLEDIVTHRETVGYGEMLKVSDASGTVTAVNVTDLLGGSGSLSADEVMSGVDTSGMSFGGFPFNGWTWELVLGDGASEVTGTPTVQQVLTGMFGIRAKWGGEPSAPTTPTTPTTPETPETPTDPVAPPAPTTPTTPATPTTPMTPTTPETPTAPEAPAAPETPTAPTTPETPMQTQPAPGAAGGSTTVYRGTLTPSVQRLGSAAPAAGSGTGTTAAAAGATTDAAAEAAAAEAEVVDAQAGNAEAINDDVTPQAAASPDTGGVPSPGYEANGANPLAYETFPWLWILIPCLLIALIVGGAGGYVWGSRRSSDRERSA